MQINYSVKFNSGEPYQMNEMMFSIGDDDTESPVKDLPISDRIFYCQFLLLKMGILFRQSAGNFTLAQTKVELEKLMSSTVGQAYKRIMDGLKQNATT